MKKSFSKDLLADILGEWIGKILTHVGGMFR
jgi:hypothetical protein